MIKHYFLEPIPFPPPQEKKVCWKANPLQWQSGSSIPVAIPPTSPAQSHQDNRLTYARCWYIHQRMPPMRKQLKKQWKKTTFNRKSKRRTKPAGYRHSGRSTIRNQVSTQCLTGQRGSCGQTMIPLLRRQHSPTCKVPPQPIEARFSERPQSWLNRASRQWCRKKRWPHKLSKLWLEKKVLPLHLPIRRLLPHRQGNLVKPRPCQNKLPLQLLDLPNPTKGAV